MRISLLLFVSSAIIAACGGRADQSSSTVDSISPAVVNAGSPDTLGRANGYGSLSLGIESDSVTDDDRCFLIADIAGPLFVQVWSERKDNSKGMPVFNGRLLKTDRRMISSGTERIIFQYQYSTNDALSAEVHAWCHNGDNVRVP